MGKSLVLGFFDGVHKGHRAVIESAYSNDITLITFKESPAVYFGHKPEYIFSRKNSIEKIKTLEVNEVVALDFSQIASLTAEEYLKLLVDNYKPISISTGFNHTFGLNKCGNADFLKQQQDKYGYKYICIPPVGENGEIVSSTLIKNYIRNGNVEYANILLESPFMLEGTVIHGAKLGRTIGFPTANIKYPENIVKLPYGVYKVRITDYPLTKILSRRVRELNGVMNWGMKPTVNNALEPVIEVHILDFDGDLYGKDLKIEVLKQIRTEKKFGSLDELKAQINEDIKQCLKL